MCRCHVSSSQSSLIRTPPQNPPPVRRPAAKSRKTMNLPKFSKDQIKKLSLSAMGFVFLLYVYFTFFLGPLQKARAGTLAQIANTQTKIDNSKSEVAKAATLERQAKDAMARFAALKALTPEGAPIAWFPPKMKTFFANQGIDRAVGEQHQFQTTRARRLDQIQLADRSPSGRFRVRRQINRRAREHAAVAHDR